jgi:hypothetical protein
VIIETFLLRATAGCGTKLRRMEGRTGALPSIQSNFTKGEQAAVTGIEALTHW